ncbi:MULTISPECIES: CHAP domain-containing protein [unclassified Aeromicrobium]|uniref:CHAP domain-containing protein n=2 Tax=Aeromicrobium TaxID=2040 RepID=UPI000A794E98|nr:MULTISPECIES: CHAP domain-containing protein [unclassified Aeromicrobium]
MSQSRVLTALISFAASLAVVGGLIVSAGVSAQAGSSLLCSGYASCKRAGYDHFGYETKQRTSYWRMYTGTNCTNYVAYRLITTNGMPNVRPKSGVGNARDWGTAMASVTDQTPTVGSVAWWGRTGNHVAYVEKVASPTEIIVSESNWGRTFDHRRITKSGSGWPDGFIHFADPDTTPAFSATPRPTFTGGETVGSRLSATTSAWKPGASFTYQWYADGKAISGASSATYTLAAGDLGKAVRVIVTGKKSGYPTKSLASTRITDAVTAGSFASTSRPTFSGQETVGSRLVASTPAWSPTAQVSYQWYADGKPIPGATSAVHTVDADQLGAKVRVLATATRPGYTSRTLASERLTGPVAPGGFTTTPRPELTGEESVGSTLTATTAPWSPEATLAHQWYADGKPIAGATSATYTLTAADRGKKVRVIVTGTRDGFTTRSLASVRITGPVAAGRFTTAPRPELTGEESVGSTLTATTAPWSGDAALAYQWYADGKPIVGATSATYTLTAADRGKKVRVIVTGTRDGFTTRSLASVRITGPVAAGRFTTAPRPEFTGAESVGSTLTATTAPWSPSARFTYQWYADGRAVRGATRTTYTLTAADRGKKVRVIVTGTRDGFTTRSLASVRITAGVTAKSAATSATTAPTDD